jgi:ABC-type microcin C transport system permease subunit YejE
MPNVELRFVKGKSISAIDEQKFGGGDPVQATSLGGQLDVGYACMAKSSWITISNYLCVSCMCLC